MLILFWGGGWVRGESSTNKIQGSYLTVIVVHLSIIYMHLMNQNHFQITIVCMCACVCVCVKIVCETGSYV